MRHNFEFLSAKNIQFIYGKLSLLESHNYIGS